MVGGKVVGLVKRGDELLLNVSDGGDECVVRCGVRRTDTGRAVRVVPGDSVWWQCGKVYWTPKRGTSSVCRYEDDDDVTEGTDIPLGKIGYSH